VLAAAPVPRDPSSPTARTPVAALDTTAGQPRQASPAGDHHVVALREVGGMPTPRPPIPETCSACEAVPCRRQTLNWNESGRTSTSDDALLPASDLRGCSSAVLDVSCYE
jgi:hypothetical protein